MIYSGYNPRAKTTTTAKLSSGGSKKAEIKRLGHEVERLLMITESLWELMKREHGYTDDDLAAQIEAVDLKDGKLDGQVAPQFRSCEKCGRGINPKHDQCLFCGEEAARGPFER